MYPNTVTDQAGKIVTNGATVTDFRGGTATFIGVDAPPVPSKEAKIKVQIIGARETYVGWSYASVYGLRVSTYICPECEEIALPLPNGRGFIHVDGEPLCPVMSTAGYVSADAVEVAP